LIEDLVYDVGMHRGEDTSFYLKRGFRVVAVEANPELVAQARVDFADAIDAGRLTLVHAAIADHEGTTTFYLNRTNSVWSTIEREWADIKEERFGTTFEAHEVACCRFETLLARYGIPFYLKIDIEGADSLCLTGLHWFGDRPAYVSTEIAETHPYEDLCHLFALGYRRFKLVDQARREPNFRFRHVDGREVEHRFDPDASGPFGEETPGNWLTFVETIPKYKRVLEAHRALNRERPWPLSVVDRIRPRLPGYEPPWFDLHAAFGRPPPRSSTSVQRPDPVDTPSLPTA
jgi:FkbM family methyltransferase